MGKFTVARYDELVTERGYPLSTFFVLSPCVWKEHGRYHVLVRAVNRSEEAAEKVARIFYGAGDSALRFTMDASPAIAPGPQEDDKDGAEDPTLASSDGTYYVFYSGWNQSKREGHLLLASGRDIRHLTKQGRVLGDTGFRNAKEATIVKAADGNWRLFFEFAEDDRSKIGCATAASLAGPWTCGQEPFRYRDGAWDSWHLSPGPVITREGGLPVMFYNGADQNARWRIGWVEFDKKFGKITGRCEDPLVHPPREKRHPDDTDIAFASSAVEEGHGIGLYYSIADQYMMRALVARPAAS